MRWSWKIGKLAGVDLYVHATFVLIIGWVGVAAWLQARTVDLVLSSIGFTLALFLCVILHEYGHALTARRYGIQTKDITLLPIGGVARLERMPEKPSQEFWVAVAGPAVNLALAAVLAIPVLGSGAGVQTASLSMGTGTFFERLLAVNLFLVAFNLIPAFPMDGGRVLRALLASRMEYTRATAVAASLGQGIALIFGLIGLFTNPFLVFIAFFVWIGAGQEASMVEIRSALSGIPVSRAMITDFARLAPTDPVSRAVSLVLAGSQRDFPVEDGEAVVGIMTRDALLQALSAGQQDQPVGQIMERDFEVAEVSDMLERASDPAPDLRLPHHACPSPGPAGRAAHDGEPGGVHDDPAGAPVFNPILPAGTNRLSQGKSFGRDRCRHSWASIGTTCRPTKSSNSSKPIPQQVSTSLSFNTARSISAGMPSRLASVRAHGCGSCSSSTIRSCISSWPRRWSRRSSRISWTPS